MTSDDTRLAAAHEALGLGREKKILPGEVLRRLVDGQVLVPLHAMPQIEDDAIVSWDPASLAKADGSNWIVVFTLREYLDAFCAANPACATYMKVDTRWVVTRLPGNLGIVFNPQTPGMLQWSAPGIAKYRQDFMAG